MQDALAFLSDPRFAGAVIIGFCTLVAAFISRGRSDRRLRKKRNGLRAKLKQVCPHVEVDSHDDQLTINSLCFHMTGNQWLICILCHSSFPEDRVRRMLVLWSTKSLEDAYRDTTDRLQKAESLRLKLDKLGYD